MMRFLPATLPAILAAAALLAAVPPALAANARNPYGNVDRRVDAGNDTGNSQVDRLNDMQLERNYRGPRDPAAPRPYGLPGNAPPPDYAPPGYPPPGYAPSPYRAPRPY